VNWWPLRIGWGTAALWALPQLAIWIAEIGIVRRLALRWPIESSGKARKVLAHGVLSVLFGLGGLLVLDFSDRVLHWSVALGAPSSIISNLKYTIIHLHLGIGVYWVTLAVTQAVRYRGSLQEEQHRLNVLAEDLAQAQLAVLRSQLSPHFLFNTLNSIAVAIRQDPRVAESMVYRLGEFLRLTLETGDVAEVTLEEELGSVSAYLAIEQVRFGNKLRITIHAEPEARRCLVPTLVLQPLVENAIRHAITTRPGGGRLEITAWRQDRHLRITVRDDGPGLVERPVAAGLGLRNTRSRLETHYGQQARLTLRGRPEGGAEALLEIPIV
jgi:LytS/YehU family sensor histidine kinase